MRAVAAIALLWSMGCGGSPVSPGVPIWERPGLYGAARPEMGPPQPGDAAPDFELPMAGGPFRLASLRGSWVLLHFTASWCPYCDAEVEHLGELSDAYGSRQLKVILIGVKEEPARWNEYTRGRVASSVVVLSDDRGEVAKRYAPPHAQPSFEDRSQVMLDSTVLVDPRGTIRLFLFPDSKHFDPTFRSVRAELERMLGGQGVGTRGAGPSAPPESPEKVVAIAVSAPPVEVGGHGGLVVRLRIKPRYHVMSDRPSDPLYIATRVTVEGADELTWQEARYPTATAFALSDKSISTFQGDVSVEVPFVVTTTAHEGVHPLAGTVRYQACTEGSCMFPVTEPFVTSVRVGRAQSPASISSP
jgi:peroxiredoxin